jgi:hypothetical protein
MVFHNLRIIMVQMMIVAYSKDAGKTWNLSSNVPIEYVRYGAFPTEDIWYISSGIWGESYVTNEQTEEKLKKCLHH